MIVLISKVVAVASAILLGLSIVMILTGIIGGAVITYAFAQYYDN